MKGSSSRIFAFVSGFLIGILTVLGFQFLLMNNFNPSSIFDSSSNNVIKDTLIDNRKVALKQKKVAARATEKTNTVEDSTEYLYEHGEESESEDSEIVIAREQLIQTIELPLILIEADAQSKLQDSLIKELQGAQTGSGNFVVEFWDSPVNFKGYQLFASRIKLFGLSPDVQNKLYKYQKRIFLKNGSDLYELTPNDNYEAFVKVRNEQLINLMK